MNLLQENKNNLTITSHPGCIYDAKNHSYLTGPVGVTGSYNYSVDHSTVPSLKSKEFTLQLNSNDEQLFADLLNTFKESQKHEDVSVTTGGLYKRTSKVVKVEYEQVVKQIEVTNEGIKQKFNELVKQLTELGCDTYELGYPKLITIPDEYYLIKELPIDYTNSYLKVCCHQNTNSYKLIESAK